MSTAVLVVLLVLAALVALGALLLALVFFVRGGSAEHRRAQAVAENTSLRQELARIGPAEHHRAQAVAENVTLRQALSRLAAERESLGRQLARFQSIVDAESHAQRVRADADQYATHAQAEGRRIWEHANAESAALRDRAAAEAQGILADARRQEHQAQGVVASAAGEAQRLEQVAAAMRNVIKGYGDQYVRPTAGLLDVLARELGFSEPGEALKRARSQTKELLKRGAAASCDYVESSRRSTAIAFVLDAFNGKVDSVLADIRHDNFGTLERKIQDAFHLVNQNGSAFRNARITTEYLAARTAELHWGVVVQELKLRQREEQRLLKERIREEEKAQREYERAQREAMKEEDSIRQALNQAHREAEQASGQQRAHFELQLQALRAQLERAEEKNRRALSMAQQTRSGHVYVISNIGSFGEDVFKIGMTRRLEPLDRVRELGDASVPFDFDVHALIASDDAPSLEHELHRRFVRKQVNKVNPRKEFFAVSLEEIRREVAHLGVPAIWTIEAECRQYRETQAIERAMASNTIDERAWEEQQLREQSLPEALHEDDAAYS